MTKFDYEKFPQSGWYVDSFGETVNIADNFEKQSSGYTAFNEMLMVERTQIFNLSAVYPLSKLRDVISGTVVHETSEYRISPGSSLESADILRYIPGFTAEMGVGVRTEGTGADVKFGAFDTNNGFYWHEFTGDFEVGIRSGGVDNPISRADWNIDKLDGTGRSGLNIGDGTDGLIFQILYTYYGYGPVIWWVQDNRSGLKPRMWIAHIEGEFANGTSTNNSNLPIRVENAAGSTADVFCAGRQASILGKFSPAERPTTVLIPTTTVSDTWTPVASVRRAVGNEQISFATDEVTITNEGAEPIYAMVVISDSVTNADWTATAENRSAAETFLEFDLAGTAVVNPEAISRIISVPGTSRASSPRLSGQNSVKIRIPRNLPASVVVKTKEAAASSDVSGAFTALEEW